MTTPQWGRRSFLEDMSSRNDLRPHYTLVKRKRNHSRSQRAASHVDLDLGVRRAQIDWDVRHPDRLLEKRRLRTARDDADAVPIFHHRMSVARDAAIEHLEADEFAAGTGGALRDKRFAADEVALVPTNRP